MKPAIAIVFSLLWTLSSSQTTYYYPLTDANLHITPEPAPVSGVHPPTDYSTVTKPLVVEAYADNIEIAADAGAIHPGASGVSNVFYGGDQPGADGFGASAVPIYTRQTFAAADFPIYLESDFYSEINIPPYNEHYFFIIPADYTYFGSPTYYVNGNDAPKEGVLIGGRPFQSWINLNHDTSTPSNMAQIVDHNLAANGLWYNFKVVLDIASGALVVREIRVNDQCLHDVSVAMITPVPVPAVFRIGLCVDDLARDFTFITNYKSLEADFAAPDTVCAGACIDLTSAIASMTCTDDRSIQWSFPGATTTSSTEEHPTGICYPTEGKYLVTLAVDNTVDTATLTREIVAVQQDVQVAIVDPGILCSGYAPLQLEVEITGLQGDPAILWSGAGVDAQGIFDPKAVPAGISTVGVVIEHKGCQYPASLDIEIVEQPTADFVPSPTEVCLDTAVHLRFTGRASPEADLNWDLDGGFVAWGTYPTDFGVQWSEPGEYLVHFNVDDRGCIASTARDIFVGTQLDTPVVICQKRDIHMVTVVWDPVPGARSYEGYSALGSGSVAGTTYTVTGLPDNTDIRITISAEGAPGCAPVLSEITCRTLSLADPEIFIPNIFSPDLDGMNDVFYVQTNDDVVEVAALSIFDRWGHLVFEKFSFEPNNPAHGWDGTISGKPAAAGVYVCHMSLSISDGSTVDRAGTVTLVR